MLKGTAGYEWERAERLVRAVASIVFWPTAARLGNTYWEHAVAVRDWFASAFVAVSIAALMVASQPALVQTATAQTATAPAAKSAKRPAAKAAPKQDAQGEDGEPSAPAVKKKRDPAEAQRQIDSGIKLFQDGKAEPAIQMLTSATVGGGLPPQQMGRALYYRGMAYRKANKPAQAISDLTSALWLKNGLTESDRADALKQRSEAYREAGLPDQTDNDGKPSGLKPSKSASAGEAAKAPAPAPASSGNFLAGLFGQKTAPPPPPAEPAVRPAAATPAEPSTSAWSSQVRPSAKTAETPASASVGPPSVAASEPPPARAAKTPRQKAAAVQPQPAPTAAPAVAAKPDGKFRARVALVRSRADAEAIVARLRVQHASAIGNAGAEITEASFGNMGNFFQVRVGPFPREADATSVCTRLKGSGLDCVPVDR